MRASATTMDIDAFILIGGRSSRLGVDKAFVELDGEPLAARAARTVEAALSPRHLTLLTSSDGQFDAKLLFGFGYPVVADLKPGFGAWSGLHTALAYARSNWALVLACDLPFITTDLLKILAGHMTGEFDAVVPRQQDGRLQPLCALYSVEHVGSKIGSIFDRGRSLPQLAEFIETLNSRIVEPAEYAELPGHERLFVNINTEKELAAVKSELAQYSE